jgi:hypothetical protein
MAKRQHRRAMPTPRLIREAIEKIADSMSRPWSSVPSQNVPPEGDADPGGSRLSITSSWARS